MKRRATITAILILTVAGYVYTGYFLLRQNFIQYLSVYLFLFTGYIFLCKQYTSLQLKSSSEKWFPSLSIVMGAGILFRLLFLFSVPVLSDDFYRFIWDGSMLANGRNPFTIIPSSAMLNAEFQNAYLWNIYAKMNSQPYYTVYPPVCQFVFGTAVRLFSNNMIESLFLMHAACIASDIGSIFLIRKLLKYFNLPEGNVILYALNPLVIIELSGNLHFEAIMIFFLLLSIWLLIRSAMDLSALAMGCAISVKLIPLMFLPFFIRRLNRKQSIIYFLITGFTVLILFLPFINQNLIDQFGSSLSLYFKKFEFNASLYYVIRGLGLKFKGYDIIKNAGPLLGLITFVLIIAIAALEKKLTTKNHILSMQWALTIYLFMATIVHPWYVTTLIAFSVFTEYRYIMFWSLLIAFSYNAYQSQPYHENLWFTATEYVLVFSVLIYELLGKRIQSSVQKLIMS
ncbi:MAG: hypothetical protein H0W62_08290 [Chitinophagales bacterium]|nr:hypothetical protein [Chitinophagales bacterium]